MQDIQKVLNSIQFKNSDSPKDNFYFVEWLLPKPLCGKYWIYIYAPK